MIYKQIGLNIDSKYFPYESFVENIFTNLEFDYAKKTEIGIYPIEMMDDANIYSVGSFQYYNDTYITTQPNGTVFSNFRKSDFFERVDDRVTPLPGNENAPMLTLGKMHFRVGSTIEVILRSYDKFSNFLAETGAILTNLLMVFGIVMSQVNQINGKN